MSAGDPIIESSLNGGAGGVIVGDAAVTIPSGSKIVAYTSFADAPTIIATGNIDGGATGVITDASNTTIPKGVTIFGRWTAFEGDTAKQGIAYFG
jgi:hypothetical protein